MTLGILAIIILALGLIFSGILLLKQSAKKFNLTEEQLTKINERNDDLNKEEEKEDN